MFIDNERANKLNNNIQLNRTIMYKKIKEKRLYDCIFRDKNKVELFSVRAPFWNLKDAQEYANERLEREKQTMKSLKSVVCVKVKAEKY